MKSLVFNKFILDLKRKNIKTILILFLYIVIQFGTIINEAKTENLNVTQMDFFVKICGGLGSDFSMLEHLRWVIMVSILMLLTRRYSAINHIDLMLLNRMGSRVSWWSYKVSFILLTTIFYTIIVVILSKLISTIFLPMSNQWSSYSRIYYSKLINENMFPKNVEYIILIIMITGFIALTTMFQTMNIIFNNSIKSFMAIFIINIILGGAYMSGLIPRLFSPIHYSSSLDLFIKNYNYLNYIIYNLIASLINIILGFIIARKKDYINLMN